MCQIVCVYPSLLLLPLLLPGVSIIIITQGLPKGRLMMYDPATQETIVLAKVRAAHTNTPSH